MKRRKGCPGAEEIIAYYLARNPELFAKFAKDVLCIDDMEAEFKIQRERNNIDIWIESKRIVIVIENKVKSNLNGVTHDGKTQLDKYFDYAEKYCAEMGKKSFYYVFVPDYSAVDLSGSAMEEYYKIVLYSQLHSFFKKNETAYASEKYFKDFVIDLGYHAKSYSERMHMLMERKFVNRLLAIKAENKIRN